MVLALFFVVFAATLLIGVPISFCLGLATIAALIGWQGASLFIIAQTATSSMASFPMMAIPFFLMAGDLMGVGGIVKRLVEFCNLLVGRFRGGLAHTTVLSEMIFSGVTGSAAADTAALGSILIPAMVEEGYGLSFSAAVTSAACTLGPIIPPSICMVIYAVIAGNISIGALFAAGFLPGALTGLGFMIVSYFIARRRQFPTHRVEITVRTLVRSLGDASYALVMPVFIMAALIFGVCTATEVGALACLYAVFIGIFVTKKLKWGDLIPIALRAGIITSAILMLISVGYVASWFFAVHQVAQKIGDFMLAVSSGPIPFLLLTNVILLISGCLLDIGAGMVLLVPILLPIATHYGVHPYHFAFMVNYALIVGLITPPVGVILFVCVGMRKDLTMEQLVLALPPFLMVMLVILLMVTFIPDVSLIVPRMLGMIK